MAHRVIWLRIYGRNSLSTELGIAAEAIPALTCYNSHMEDRFSPDTSRHDATGREDGDIARQKETRHSLTLDQVGNIYAERGFPRSARSLQRFCSNGHLDCSKIATTTGDKYLVAPYSVERHLKQLAQLQATEAATRSSLARHVTTSGGQASDSQFASDDRRRDVRHTTTGDDVSEPVEQMNRDTSQLVVQLEKRIGDKDDEIKFLRSEVATKNNQLADASERDRETNVLIQGLQSMVLQLTGNESSLALGEGITHKRGGDEFQNQPDDQHEGARPSRPRDFNENTEPPNL